MGAMERITDTGSSIVQKHTDPMSEWSVMREQAQTLVASGFLPKTINTPEKAIAVMMTGRELSIAPMQAFRSIHVIEGRPSLSAELMAALVLARIPGALLRVSEATGQRCSVEAGRPGQQAVMIQFTIDDARSAGLLGKDNWKKYPRAMLRSRATSEACRTVFPDAIMGMYTPDELGALVDEGGNPLPVLPAADRQAQHLQSSATAQHLPGGDIDQIVEMLATAQSVDDVKAASSMAKHYRWTKQQLDQLKKAGEAAMSRVAKAPENSPDGVPADELDRGDSPDNY